MTEHRLAFAKLNLSLAVLGRRSDGFHEVESLVQTVNLSDAIDLDVGEGHGIEVENSLRDLQGPDLAYRAATLLLEAKGITRRVDIRIQKGIPAGAGLGGGSSDAAAVLDALDRLTPPRLAPEALRALAARLGSDVPLFLLGGRVHVAGRGEMANRVAAAGPNHFVIVTPPVHCPTPDVYAAWDRLPASPATPLVYGRNDLLRPALLVRPELARVRDAVAQSEAPYSGMSGSGSSFYTAHASAADAARSADHLRRALPDCHVQVCRSTDSGSVARETEET